MMTYVRKREDEAKSSQYLLPEASPDSECPICLDLFDNVASLDRCLHRFCYRCIHEWSNYKRECPLCKLPFSSIFHSIGGQNDFKEYVLPTTDNEPAMPPAAQVDHRTHSGRVRRSRTSRGRERHSERHQNVEPIQNAMPPASLADLMFTGLNLTMGTEGRVDPEASIHGMMLRLMHSQHWRIEEHRLRQLRDQDMVAYRRALYQTGMRVRSGSVQSNRQGSVSAAYLLHNPVFQERLLPWLHRELTVLYGSHVTLVSVVKHLIMSHIKNYNMDTNAIQDQLRPFLLERTDHFIHELVCFARSPLSIEAYDQQAVYELPVPSFEEESQSRDDNNSEDTQVTEGSTELHATPVPMATGGESGLSQSFWDDETPGPSYSTFFPSPSQSQTQGAGPVGDCVQAGEAGGSAEAAGPGEDENEDEQEDCMVVGYLKPIAERTPELVQLSSDTSEEEPEKIGSKMNEATGTKIEDLLSQKQTPLSPETNSKHQPHSKKRHSERWRRKRHRHRPSSSDSSDLSSSPGRSRSPLRNILESRRWRLQSRGRLPPVSLVTDSSDSSWSPSWKPSWKSIEEPYRACSSSSSDSLSESPIYWDLPGHGGAWKKARKKWRREKERRKSRSPLRVHADSKASRSLARGRGSRRHERHLPSSSDSSQCSSSIDSRPEKPAGKRKYKTRHLERAAQSHKRPKASRNRERSKTKRRHRGVRERTRSPSVEIIFEGRASDTLSQTHRRGRKRLKKSRKGMCSPTVITIESDSDFTGDHQDFVAKVAKVAEQQTHGAKETNKTTDCHHKSGETDSGGNHQGNATEAASSSTDYQDQDVKVANSTMDHRHRTLKISNRAVDRRFPETSSEDSQSSVVDVTDSQNSPEDLTFLPVKGIALDRILSTSATLVVSPLESSSPVTMTGHLPNSQDSVLNLEHCVVDVVDRESLEHVQHRADSEQPGRPNEQDVVFLTTIPPPSDAQLLDSILQELEDILPEDLRRVQPRNCSASPDNGVNQHLEVVPRRDQSDMERVRGHDLQSGSRSSHAGTGTFDLFY